MIRPHHSNAKNAYERNFTNSLVKFFKSISQGRLYAQNKLFTTIKQYMYDPFCQIENRNHKSN